MQGGDIAAILEPGLPNVRGSVNYASDYGFIQTTAIVSGAFIVGETTTRTLGVSSSSVHGAYLDFNAQMSNAIYGNSTTVQPPALQLIPQIKY